MKRYRPNLTKLVLGLLLTMMVMFSFGLLSVVDSGSFIALLLGNTSESAALTSRKKTRIVNMSIRETMFKDADLSLRRL